MVHPPSKHPSKHCVPTIPCHLFLSPSLSPHPCKSHKSHPTNFETTRLPLPFPAISLIPSSQTPNLDCITLAHNLLDSFINLRTHLPNKVRLNEPKSWSQAPQVTFFFFFFFYIRYPNSPHVILLIIITPPSQKISLKIHKLSEGFIRHTVKGKTIEQYWWKNSLNQCYPASKW